MVGVDYGNGKVGVT